MRKNLMLYKQQEEQSITEYADELQSIYKTLHSIDGDLVPLQKNNKEKIVELYKEATGVSIIDPLDEDEIEMISGWSDDQMLGIILLLNSDKKRYSGLLVDLHNSYILGNNNYPKIFTEAFSLLLNYRQVGGRVKETPAGNPTINDTGVNFAQRQQTAVPGRNGVLHPNTTCYNCDTLGHYADQCPNPSRNTGIQGLQIHDLYFQANFNQVSFEDRLNKSSFYKTLGRLDLRRLILLDTGSTVHLFMNKQLLRKIFGSKHLLYLGTNGGINVSKEKGMYDDIEV